jgi:sugar-phosphatase
MASSLTSSPVTIRCKGILFDMDGVLISSLGSVERSWTRWAEMRGIDPAYALSIVHGRRSIETIARLRPDLDAEAENRIIEKLEIDDTDGLMVLPGVLDLLAALPAGTWTVVTSATGPLARVRLAAAGIPASGRIITADDVVQGKPDPAPYLAGAALLGFAPEECVVIEDAASGARAGRAAGCIVVATTFSHTVEQLAPANYIVSDLTEVAVTALPGGLGIELRFVPIAVGVSQQG